jgi:hypothetical protein
MSKPTFKEGALVMLTGTGYPSLDDCIGTLVARSRVDMWSPGGRAESARGPSQFWVVEFPRPVSWGCGPFNSLYVPEAVMILLSGGDDVTLEKTKELETV